MMVGAVEILNTMDDKFKYGIEALRKVKMSDGEKSLILKKILDRKETLSIKTPYISWSAVFMWVKSNGSFVAIVAAVTVILTGNGIAKAAEGSLPGDILYPIKTGIIEPARVALAATIVARAEVQTNIATTRLQEAEQLAVHNKLSEQSASQLNQSLNRDAKALAVTVASADAQTAASIKDSYRASLETHTQILEGIAASSSASSTVTQPVRTLAEKVHHMAIQGLGSASDTGKTVELAQPVPSKPEQPISPATSPKDSAHVDRGERGGGVSEGGEDALVSR